MFLSGRLQASEALRKLARALGCAGALVAAVVLPNGAAAFQSGASAAEVALRTLPFDAQQTYRLIVRGGPFPYPKDGLVFVNRERRLPSESRGFYREYTVRTPGSIDRGARRIVCGWRKPTKPETCYYTSDHYGSFQRIVP